ALVYPYTNAICEGNVNRIKMIKRQMYGRASFELLRIKYSMPKKGFSPK
ncbi:transposase, partial [Turicibacter bilis]